MLFVLAKILQFLFNPLNLILLAAFLAIILRIVGYVRVATGIAWTVMTVLIVIGTVPVGEWALQVLENRFPAPKSMPKAVTGVIVLGGSTSLPISAARGQPSVNRHGERLWAFAEMTRRYPDAIFLFSGGSGYIQNIEVREADVAAELLEKAGIDTSNVHYDPRPRNTHENAAYAAEILAPSPDDTWLLVTSAAHMPRAVGSFRHHGFVVLPYPVDYQTKPDIRLYLRIDMMGGMSDVFQAARAWSALVYYRLTGRIASTFPEP